MLQLSYVVLCLASCFVSQPGRLCRTRSPTYRQACGLVRMAGDSADFASRAVAWFDEMSMLEVIYRGQLEVDAEGASAADIEAAIAKAGGNVSGELMLEDRVLPDGDHPALQQLAVGFSVELDGGIDDESAASELRLHVRFDERYPLRGGRPTFSLQYGGSVANELHEGWEAVVAAAETAVEVALKDGDSTVIFAAISAANDATEVALRQGPPIASDAIAPGEDAASGDASVFAPTASVNGPALARGSPSRAAANASEMPISEYVTTSAGAWAVLRESGDELHSVLAAWDEQRKGSFDRMAFRQAAQALAALGRCVRPPSHAELDSMFEVLARGRQTVPLSRLLEPLDAIDSLIAQRLRGVESRTWLELDKQLEAADESYEWYTAARALRRAPDLQRDAPSAHLANLFADDRKRTTVHLFVLVGHGAAGECSAGAQPEPIATPATEAAEDVEDAEAADEVVEGAEDTSPLAACAVLLLDKQGRGVARLVQLSVRPEARTEGFETEWRLLDAASLLAEKRGHLWVAVSAAQGSSWREALLERGYRPMTVPPGEPDGQWLRKQTPRFDFV